MHLAGTRLRLLPSYSPGKNRVVLGSGELVRSQMRRNLVDRYGLSIYPPIPGSGRHLFDDPGQRVALELVDATPATTGVVIATYRPASSAAG